MTKEIAPARSAAMASIHEAAESLLKVDAIDKATMRVLDKLCLTSKPTAKQQPKKSP